MKTCIWRLKPKLSFPELPRCGKGVSSNFSSVSEFLFFMWNLFFFAPNTAWGSCDGHNALFKYFFSFLNSLNLYCLLVQFQLLDFIIFSFVVHCGAVVYSAKNVGVLQSQILIIRTHCLLAELPFQLLDFIIFKTHSCRALQSGRVFTLTVVMVQFQEKNFPYCSMLYTVK